MKEKKKEPKIVKYTAKSYSYSITKVFTELSSAEKFILETREPEIQFKVTLIEFQESFFIKNLQDAEAKIEKIIQGKLNKLYYSEPRKVPIPIKDNKNFSGTLSLRISSTMHKQLYVESVVTDMSINKLIEMKLKK